MIIISKKRISFIIIMLVVTIFGYSVTTNTNKNTIAVSSLPVSNKVIILDAGHGKPDEGAESSSRYNRSRN